MPAEKITKRSVDALKPATSDLFIWDTDLSGFGIKITPKGFKTYVIQYRMAGRGRRGTAKRIVLGKHGELTPDEARKLARRELAKVAHGGDPAEDRAAKKRAPTVHELGSSYLEDVDTRHKTSTTNEYRRLWKKHVIPALGVRPVADVTHAEIRRLHRSLSATPYLANRVAAMLGAFFTFAEKEEVRPRHDNPAHGIEFFEEKSRERFLTEREFGQLGKALTLAEDIGLPPSPQHRRRPKNPKAAKHRPKSADKPIPANPFGVAAIRLLILTGCRENEILTLPWSAVDFERGYLRLTDTKTGKSNRPLSSGAAAVLNALPRIHGNPFVLPGLKAGTHVREIKRLWYAVRHAAKLDDVRLHDLRHSFASVPASSGESLLIIRSLLGHKRTATSEKYAHLSDDPVKRAADAAAGQIARWLNGER